MKPTSLAMVMTHSILEGLSAKWHGTLHARGEMVVQTPYSSENDLVNALFASLSAINAPWNLVAFAREFYYNRGRVDVIALTDFGEVVAFEAKLSRWREALHQAYRNRCLAHESYVVLPESAARLATTGEHEFLKRGVGLCSWSDNGLSVLLRASKGEPLQPWLTNRATLATSRAFDATNIM